MPPIFLNTCEWKSNCVSPCTGAWLPFLFCGVFLCLARQNFPMMCFICNSVVEFLTLLIFDCWHAFLLYSNVGSLEVVTWSHPFLKPGTDGSAQPGSLTTRPSVHDNLSPSYRAFWVPSPILVNLHGLSFNPGNYPVVYLLSSSCYADERRTLKEFKRFAQVHTDGECRPWGSSPLDWSLTPRGKYYTAWPHHLPNKLENWWDPLAPQECLDGIKRDDSIQYVIYPNTRNF